MIWETVYISLSGINRIQSFKEETVKLIYHGYFGVYSAFLLAAFHVGILDEKKAQSREFLRKYWRFCRLYGPQYGNLIYVGVDKEHREVYCIGCKKHGDVVIKAQRGMNEIFQIGDEIRYVDTGKMDGLLPTIISAMQKRPFFDRISFFLFSYWVRKTVRHCLERADGKIKEGDQT